jgi:hypothetical protein
VSQSEARDRSLDRLIAELTPDEARVGFEGPSMTKRIEAGPSVPRVPLRRLDDLAGRIETLIVDARQQGYGTLAYFLETALIEARIQLDRDAGERRARDADPKDLWLPGT